jgi:hypothetical protein
MLEKILPTLPPNNSNNAITTIATKTMIIAYSTSP